MIGLLAIFAGGFYAGYLELASINRDLGGVLVKNEEFERRLTRLEEGQIAIRTDLGRVIGRLDMIDTRLGTIEQTIKNPNDRAEFDPSQ